MSILEAALAYAAGGWPVFPVGRDKAPLTKHGFQDATTHPELLRELWRLHPEVNVALGIPEGLVILDFDPRNGAPEPEVFKWGETYPLRCGTPSGGSHLYFRIPLGVELVGKWMPGIDVKVGGKGYVLLPPSRNEDGRTYEWYAGDDPTGYWELDHLVPELPQWILTTLTKPEATFEGLTGGQTSEPVFPWDVGTPYGEYGLQQQMGFLAMAREGERNTRLNRVGFRIGQLVAGGELKEDALFQVARVAEWIGLERDEVGVTLRSAYDAGSRKPWVR
jgi:hypothetical protein